jgi:hypothetical protein
MSTGSTSPKINEAQRILDLTKKFGPGSPPGAGVGAQTQPGQPSPKK